MVRGMLSSKNWIVAISLLNNLLSLSPSLSLLSLSFLSLPSLLLWKHLTILSQLSLLLERREIDTIFQQATTGPNPNTLSFPQPLSFMFRHTLPLEYSASISNSTGTWTGRARIPANYFPPDVTLFNAYAIHGTGDGRIYEALYESSGPQPDFHRLEKFQPIEFSRLLPNNKGSELSALWRVSIEESELAKNQ